MYKKSSGQFTQKSTTKKDRHNNKLSKFSCNDFKEKVEKLFGFCFKDISSFENFVRLMYKPTDPSSLGVSRFLFGLLMMLDIPEERAGAEIDLRWGEPRNCHFPLIPFIQPVSLPYMGLIYGIMWIGALGIMLGYKFRLSAILFAVPYWYIFLIDKSFWNNHSYLFGLCAILFIGTSANHYMSIDGLLDQSKRDRHVPYWNYFILKFQFFVLYFFAGIKKSSVEWLEGYAMTNLSRHWVFDPFKIFLTVEQIDFLIVHWFAFIFDLTVGFWMIVEWTRPYAMLFCASFHFMNSRLFSIGMFPYVCLATMPLFCNKDWPRKIHLSNIWRKTCVKSSPSPSESCIYSKTFKNENKQLDFNVSTSIGWKHKFVVCLLLSHCGLQTFLPYSHFITKGYNNWTNGLYGYSWDMMVHAWDTVLVVIKVVDNNSGQEHFLDPNAWVLNDRWTKHGDMMYQYAHCLKRNLIEEYHNSKNWEQNNDDQLNNINMDQYITSENISIYIDVWCSMNGRFQQRMFNPNYDLLKVDWSPFKPVEWLMPLLTEFSGWRNKLTEIQRDVYSWSNYSDVIFVADFPGLYLENYITTELTNVTLTVLEGEIYFEIENRKKLHTNGIKLSKLMSIPIRTGIFHKIQTISSTPASYMYTYINQTKLHTEMNTDSNKIQIDIPSCTRKSPFPLIEEIDVGLENIYQMFKIIGNSILNLLYGVPMLRRLKVH